MQLGRRRQDSNQGTDVRLPFHIISYRCSEGLLSSQKHLRIYLVKKKKVVSIQDSRIELEQSFGPKEL